VLQLLWCASQYLAHVFITVSVSPVTLYGYCHLKIYFDLSEPSSWSVMHSNVFGIGNFFVSLYLLSFSAGMLVSGYILNLAKVL
jgi:membrane-associated protease RseP (regulator of RpoE activity)